MILALGGVSIPAFWLGLMLLIVFSVWLKWFPSTGTEGLHRLILPAICSATARPRSSRASPAASLLEVLGPGVHDDGALEGPRRAHGDRPPRAPERADPGDHDRRAPGRHPALGCGDRGDGVLPPGRRPDARQRHPEQGPAARPGHDPVRRRRRTCSSTSSPTCSTRTSTRGSASDDDAAQGADREPVEGPRSRAGRGRDRMDRRDGHDRAPAVGHAAFVRQQGRRDRADRLPVVIVGIAHRRAVDLRRSTRTSRRRSTSSRGPGPRVTSSAPTISGATSPAGCSTARRCRSRSGSSRWCSRLVLGVLFGLPAGYFGGSTDMLVSRLVDILLAFPSILLAL